MSLGHGWVKTYGGPGGFVKPRWGEGETRHWHVWEAGRLSVRKCEKSWKTVAEDHPRQRCLRGSVLIPSHDTRGSKELSLLGYISASEQKSGCVRYFLTTVMTYPTESNLRQAGLILAHSLRGYSPLWQGRHGSVSMRLLAYIWVDLGAQGDGCWYSPGFLLSNL